MMTIISLFILTAHSRKKNGRRRSGYRIVGYVQGCEVFRQGEVLGEHAEVYDTEMAGLWAAAEEMKRYILDVQTEPKPERVIFKFYADNLVAITKIFEGVHGKAQQHLKGFRRVIGLILCDNTETKFTISWCPDHSGIIGNATVNILCSWRILSIIPHIASL